MTIKKLFFTLILALNSTLLLAAQDECPSIDFIREKAHFTSAHTFMERYYWILTSDNFEYKNKKWNILFLTRLLESDPMKALAAGQKFYDSQVKLNPPGVDRIGDEVYCVYAEDERYGLTAVSPPTRYVD